VLDLGRTEDGRLGHRLVRLAGARAGLGRWGRRVERPDVVLARSLEALVLARAYRDRFAPGASLVYESLDIHGLLLGDRLPSRVLRAVEARALRECSALVTSSPGFVREYFARHHAVVPPVVLAENKVLATEIGPLPALLPRPDGPPWTIGWFGLLRCPRSLALLAALCRRFPGRVRVEIRGRPAASLGADLVSVAAATPGMTFHGPYDRATDLPRIYSEVQFSWTADFLEAGANSDWLLPNRLYEAGPFGCVPIAPADGETGRWLAARNAGVRLSEPWEQTLPQWLEGLTVETYRAVRARSCAVPTSDFVDDDGQAADFVARISRTRATSAR
jgi:succinoglycan biosynthesis protein ExoL